MPAEPSDLALCMVRRQLYTARRGYELAKRFLDVAICLALLPIALPLIAVCAAMIWIEDGRPIAFCQARTGRGGYRFRMFKFRTMVHNAEQLKAQYLHLNELTWPDFKLTNDPRVTRVGQFLRKSSLDELPQIINVLRGDMSLVGPRPTSFAASTYELIHTERLEVPPGITGLWQISGRSDIDFQERLRLDLDYIEHRSLLLDLKILLATPVAVLLRRGAY